MKWIVLCGLICKGIDDIDAESEAAEADAEKTQNLPDFSIEYARVDQDSCKGCEQLIKMGEMRAMKFVRDENDDNNNNSNNDSEIDDTVYSGRAHWYHVACFVRLRTELDWLCAGESLPGFKRLSADDKDVIRNQIP